MTHKPLHALFTGSFDPVTRGHEDIIRRASALFDRVTVTVFINKDKQGLFTPAERVELLRTVCLPYENVSVCRDEGMVSDFVLREGIDLILRSVRDEKDMVYEKEMAAYNKAHCGKETLLLLANENLSNLSSTEVRRRLASNEDASDLVPACIWEKVRKKAQTL